MRVPVTTSKKTEIANRRKLVAQYYLNKMKEEDIAVKLSVTVGTISGDLKAMRAKWNDEAQAAISEHVSRELAELELMELEAAAMYQHFKGNKERGTELNSKEANKWFETRLKIKERRAKLLGLDGPQKIISANTEISEDSDIKKLKDQMKLYESIWDSTDDSIPDKEV